jgi:hypothetical protein
MNAAFASALALAALTTGLIEASSIFHQEPVMAAEMALPDLWLKLYWMIHFAFLAFAEGLAVPRY